MFEYFVTQAYGMSEVGLVCRQRPPSLAEMAAMDKTKAIGSKSIIQ